MPISFMPALRMMAFWRIILIATRLPVWVSVARTTAVPQGKELDVSMMDNWDDSEGYYAVRLGELINGRDGVLANYLDCNQTSCLGVSCTYDRREHSLAKVLRCQAGACFGHSCTAGQGTRRQHDG
jgi:hypothetical protein